MYLEYVSKHNEKVENIIITVSALMKSFNKLDPSINALILQEGIVLS